jgi:hypothetical protein
MYRKLWTLTFVFLLAVLVISACSPLIPRTGLNQGDAVATQNAEIVNAAVATATTSALHTQIAQLQTQVAQPTAAIEQPTETQVPPTATPEPPPATPTQAEPTATQVPPTATPVPPTPTPTTPCNAAQFVTDVSVPDGTVFTPGAYFTKTWRLRNIGACTWNSAYSMIFVSGDSLGAPAQVFLPGNVAPGQVIDLSVNMTAPGRDGSFRGNWMLRDGSGNAFGVRGSNTFFVDIRVETPRSLYPLDFAATYCQAEWTSGSGSLPCPGLENDSRGYIRRVEKPVLESGYVDNEPALHTHPQMITDGVIRGKYPSFRVEEGHTFMAVIGCAHNAKSCDVNFQLDYQVGNGSIQTRAVWHEVYEGEFTKVEVDLSDLKGQDVKFILTVFANGSSSGDVAQWVAPRIVKK